MQTTGTDATGNVTWSGSLTVQVSRDLLPDVLIRREGGPPKVHLPLVVWCSCSQTWAEKPSRKVPEAASWAAWPASSLLADEGNRGRGPPGLAAKPRQRRRGTCP